MSNFMKNMPREALPNAEEVNAADNVPWYLRYSARILATLGGVLSVVLGILAFFWSSVTLALTSVVASTLEIAVGCFVLLIEAPFMFKFLSFAQRPGEILEKNRSPFLKAVIYIVIGLIPLIMAFSVSTFFGSGLILMAGVIHAVIGFGKKAPLEQMQAAAGGGQPARVEEGNNRGFVY